MVSALVSVAASLLVILGPLAVLLALGRSVVPAPDRTPLGALSLADAARTTRVGLHRLGELWDRVNPNPWV